jgi:hypothetical protein
VDVEQSGAPDHPDLGPRVARGAHKERRTTVLYGLGPGPEFVSFNNTLVNLDRAVRERVYYTPVAGGFVPPPRPEPLEFNTLMSGFFSDLGDNLFCTAPITRQQFVDSYVGRKRIIYQKAVDSLAERSLCSADFWVKSFIKWEKNVVKPGKDLSQVVPRVISPRDPRANVCLGVFLNKTFEKRLLKSVSRTFKSLTVMKGLNAEEMAREARRKWTNFTCPVAIGADASRFDQHVSDVALKWEHSVYERCYSGEDRRELSRLLKHQLVNTCFAQGCDGTFKYVVRGGRMSGDMNTGLGNCLLMCGMFYSWMKLVGIDKYELMNNGDDCVMIIERSDLQLFSSQLPEYFTRLGFTIVLEEPVYVFEQISFCQMQPVFDGDKYVMCRDPRVSLSKDCISTLWLPRVSDQRAWLAAVGEGGLGLTGGIPVVQNFYRKLLELSVGKRSKLKFDVGWSMRHLALTLGRKYRTPSPLARYSFWLAFGIDAENQLCLERFYDSDCFSLVIQPCVRNFQWLF